MDKDEISNILKEIKEEPANTNFHHSKESIVRGILYIFLDMFIICISMVGAIWFRYDLRFSTIEPVFWEHIVFYMPINMVITILIFWRMRLYSSLWRFASLTELKYIFVGTLLSSGIMVAVTKLTFLTVPRSYPYMYDALLCFLVVCSRYIYRFGRILKHELKAKSEGRPIVTMVVGAGNAGDMIIREMIASKHLNRQIPCIIDDDPAKIGTYLHGIPVVGDRTYIHVAVERFLVQEIVIAIPSMELKDRQQILNICQSTGCSVKLLPGIYQMVNDEVRVSKLRNIDIEDLLGRDAVDTEIKVISDYVNDQTVLVTGGGGSIGSELCRQIAANNPKKLIIFDIYENSVHTLSLELMKKYPGLDFEALIGSVRDENRIEYVFSKYKPDLVFHAAAHKHVPLMESSPNEAIKNNVIGTFNVADAADRHDVKKMILISTDKAVRPTNIMGASKRICEMVIQEYAQKSKTEYAAVRFGNVLGSNGSVIPIFKQQIAEGGPVTVTDERITRFFMTIPEAASLVLQAGAFATGGEIFILDMGKPERIYDLAEKMIRLSGHIPHEDIEIKITGLRPGEKLYEELLIDYSHQTKTANEKIFVAQQEVVDMERLKAGMKKMKKAAYEETEYMREIVREIVPEYKDAEEVNKNVNPDLLYNKVQG